MPRIIALINEDRREDLVRYWLDHTLDKCLQTRLKRIGRIIGVKAFFLACLNYTNEFFYQNPDHVANAYVVQLLRHAYAKMYLEIQEAFSAWRDETLDFDDLFLMALSEPIPKNQSFPESYPLKKTLAETPPVKKPARAPREAFHSFRYKDYDQGKEKLTWLRESLASKGFIEAGTSPADFRRIFSGLEVSKPVVWLGTLCDLYYFIKLIYTVNKYVEDLKQNQWKVTCKCFVKADGSSFAFNKFRSQKKPQLTFRELEKAVSHLA